MRQGKAWVTIAPDIETGCNCLDLVKSLRDVGTEWPVLIVADYDAVGENLLKNLESEFNGVFPIKNGSNLSPKTAAQLTCLNIPFFEKMVYLHPRLRTVANPDDIFESDEFHVELDDNEELLVLKFSPSISLYQEALKKCEGNGKFSHFFPGFRKGIGQPKVLFERDSTYTSKAIRFVLPQSDLIYEHLILTTTPTQSNVGPNSIAIIGMSCRFAGANSLEDFWDLLIQGKNTASSPPEHRWPKEYFPNVTEAERNVKAGFLEIPIDSADAEFFGISPFNMEVTDPQQRIFLEVVWEALEDAGINPLTLRGTDASVFTGFWRNTYEDALLMESGITHSAYFRQYIGNGYGPTSGKISHFLGVNGINVAIDAACASSLVAVGLAITALRERKTGLAICGGVNAYSRPFDSTCLEGLTAKDGKSKTFSADADGYGRAEGCGVLLMKRLTDAVRDGDRIHAVIRGFGQVQDTLGQNMGTPNSIAEAMAMESALKDAGITPDKVSYIETHGTGTPIGDLVEVNAIAKTYCSRKEPLFIASTKPNIGHTESVSGIAGIIKTVLAMQKEVIPPHIGCTEKTVSQKLPFHEMMGQIPFQLMEWKKNTNNPRIAGVSSFGVTGTDCHAIIQESPSQRKGDDHKIPLDQNILTLSAKNEKALEDLIEKYQIVLKHGERELSDISYSANTGRAALSPFRAAVIGESPKDLADKIGEGLIHRGKCTNSQPKICFLYAGQGAQYLDMGKRLYSIFPHFKEELDKAFSLFLNLGGLDLKKLIWEGGDLNRLESSLATFCLEVSLSHLYESWGVKPDFVLGHSMGEFAAAVVSGYLNLEEAVELQLHKFTGIKDYAEEGCMVSVKASSETVEQILKDLSRIHGDSLELDISCRNSPTQFVLGGKYEAVEKFIELCELEKIKTKIISQKCAFHSRLHSPVVQPYRESIQSTKFKTKEKDCIFISSFSGNPLGEKMNSEYLVSQLTGGVNFTEACKTVYDMGVRHFLEVSPHAIISPLVTENMDSFPGGQIIATIPSMKRGSDDLTMILNALALLHVSGVNINWESFHEGFQGRKVSLPKYPFQRQKYWFTPKESSPVSSKETGRKYTLLGTQQIAASPPLKLFNSHIPLPSGFVQDHIFDGNVIFPAAGYMEMLLATRSNDTNEGVTCISNFEIHAPLLIHPKWGCDLQTLSNSDDGSVTIYGKINDCPGRKHVTGKVEQLPKQNLQTLPIPNTDWTETEARNFYSHIEELGYNFGSSFQCVKRIWREDKNTILLEVETTGENDFSLHPLIIEGMIQSVLIHKFLEDQYSLSKMFIPVSIKEFTFFGEQKEEEQRKYYLQFGHEKETVKAFSAKGEFIAEANGIEYMSTNVKNLVRAAKAPLTNSTKLPLMFEEEWVEKELKWLETTGENKEETWLVLSENSELGKKIVEHVVSLGRNCRHGDINISNDFTSYNKIICVANSCKNFLQFLQSLAEYSHLSQKILVVTKNAIPADNLGLPATASPCPPWQSILLGMTKVFRSENPGVKMKNIDVISGNELPDVIAQEALAEDNKDDFVILRGGKRYALKYRTTRVQNDDKLAIPDQGRKFNLNLPASRMLEDLTFVERTEVLPVPEGHVELSARAVGLNFRDVLNVMKPTEDFETSNFVGSDFAGVVTKVGNNCPGRFKSGDRVFGCSTNNQGIPSHYIVKEEDLAKIPEHFGFQEAATLPTVFSTVYEALIQIGGLKETDTILIHTASGGVGLCAIQAAKKVGARVIATAGSEKKRAFLRESCGLQYVFNSRNLSFGDEIRKATNGCGVSMVLNTLTSPGFKETTLSLCSPSARFIEISKMNIWSEQDVREIRPDVKYTIMDLAIMEKSSSAKALEEWTSKGWMNSLQYTSYSAGEVIDALKNLQKAQHIGKLVLQMPGNTLFSPNSTYLVTGGLGGIGFKLAEWLSSNGAEFLLLISRSVPSHDAKESIANLENRGCKILTLQADVSNYSDCEEILRQIETASFPSLRGIFHCAGTLADGLLVNQNWESFQKVFPSKVDGSWNLHKLSLEKELSLQYFVLFSSVSCIFGTVGQVNYAGANSFLDSLAGYRRSMGLPGAAINWGQWGEVGMAANMSFPGFEPFPPEKGFQAMQEILMGRKGQAIVIEGDVQEIVRRHDWTTSLFSSCLELREDSASKKGKTPTTTSAFSADSFYATFKEAEENVRKELVNAQVRKCIQRVLKSSGGDVEDATPLGELGLDSLMLIELKNLLQVVVGTRANIPLSKLSEDSSVTSLTDLVCGLLNV